MERKESNQTNRPPAKPHLNGYGLTLYFYVIFGGSGPVLLGGLYFCDFSGGGGSGPPVHSSGSAHAGCFLVTILRLYVCLFVSILSSFFVDAIVVASGPVVIKLFHAQLN